MNIKTNTDASYRAGRRIKDLSRCAMFYTRCCQSPSPTVNTYSMPACPRRARPSLGGSSRRPAHTQTRTDTHTQKPDKCACMIHVYIRVYKCDKYTYTHTYIRTNALYVESSRPLSEKTEVTDSPALSRGTLLPLRCGREKMWAPQVSYKTPHSTTRNCHIKPSNKTRLGIRLRGCVAGSDSCSTVHCEDPGQQVAGALPLR